MNDIIQHITALLCDSTQPIVVTLSGPSGSGKSTVAHQLAHELRRYAPIVLHTDNYYIGKTRMKSEMPAGEEANFDHPASMNLAQLAKDLRSLKRGHAVKSPRYDMQKSKPFPDTIQLNPAPFLIVEGLAANLPELRKLSDIPISLHLPFEARLKRRALRDVARKGYSSKETERYMREIAEPTYRKYYFVHDQLCQHPFLSD